jgi:hypothetical protein
MYYGQGIHLPLSQVEPTRSTREPTRSREPNPNDDPHETLSVCKLVLQGFLTIDNDLLLNPLAGCQTSSSSCCYCSTAVANQANSISILLLPPARSQRWLCNPTVTSCLTLVPLAEALVAN